jgi:hypothetical protein
MDGVILSLIIKFGKDRSLELVTWHLVVLNSPLEDSMILKLLLLISKMAVMDQLPHLYCNFLHFLTAEASVSKPSKTQTLT